MKKILIGLIVCILFLLVSEIIMRFYKTIKTNNKTYLTFNVSFPKKGKGDYYAFESPTYRYFRTEFQPKKPENTIRIFALGGSTTYGTCEDKETYPYYLQEILNNNYEVINVGFPLGKMVNTYGRFKEILQYQPDIIIIYAAWNDAFYPELVKREKLLWRIHNALYYKWIFYTTILEKYSLMKTGSAIPFFQQPKNIPQEFSQYLKLIITLAKKNEVEVILVKQPISNQEEFTDLENLYLITKVQYKRSIIAQYYYVRQLFKAKTITGIFLSIKAIGPCFISAAG